MTYSKLIASVFIFFISFSAEAQLFGKYIGATIIMQDESEKEGYVKSSMKAGSKSVKFKESLEGDAKEIDSDKIDYILFSNGDSHFAVKHTSWKQFNAKGTKSKIHKKKMWVSVIETCNGIEIYEDFVSVKPKKDKLVYEYCVGGHNIYLKKEDEKVVTMVALSMSSIDPDKKGPMGTKKYQKRILAKYFENDPAALKVLGDQNITYNILSEAAQRLCK